MHKPGRLVLVSGDACVHGHKRASATCGEHTCDVASGEGDAELLGLVALRLGLGHDILVQRVDDVLESRELHHRVGDLAAPQRHKRLEEAAQRSARVTAWRPSWCSAFVAQRYKQPISRQRDGSATVRGACTAQRMPHECAPAGALLGNDLGHAVGEALRVAGHGLHLDLQAHQRIST